CRVYAVPLDLDQQARPAVQEEKTIFVPMGQVAGSQPSVRTDGVGRGSRVAPVTQHHVVAPAHSIQTTFAASSRFDSSITASSTPEIGIPIDPRRAWSC